MSDGTREAHVAARWWADRLAAVGETRTGDTVNEAFAMAARSSVAPPTPDQVETFRASLHATLLGWIADPDRYWRDAVESGQHRRGGAFRRLDVDYGPDPTLTAALHAAGLGGAGMRLRLPLKTDMWVNPFHVTVRHGYHAPVVELDLGSE
jgi:hypothetical protein